MRDLTPAVVADWAHRARAGLRRHRREIDALNVFPVPDGDTGTNALLTVESGVAEVDSSLATAHEPAASMAAFAHGALLGARGNSGVILSQVLRGLSDGLAGLPTSASVEGAALVAALQRACEAAYRSVARPVEGTILTVVRAASEAAAELLSREPAATTSAVLNAAYQGAEVALGRTTDMLDALRRAGVVDAGGKAFLVVLGALRDAVDGRDQEAEDDVPEPIELDAIGVLPPEENPRGAASGQGGVAPTPTPLEVMFLLDASASGADALREQLDRLGDSVVVVGGEPLWNVHVHVEDLRSAAAVMEAAVACGHPHRITFTALPADHGSEDELPCLAQDQQRGLVAVTHGPGMERLLADSGVTCIPALPGMRASTREIIDAITATGAGEVVVLPSDSDTQAVAQAAATQARRPGLRVAVVPTRSIVQTLAAVAVHSPMADFDGDVIAMTRAAGATRYAAVTIARRDALTTAGPCQIGDVLGLVNGDIALVGTNEGDVARTLVSGLLAVGGELVTCVLGRDADDELRALPGWIRARFPLVEVSVHEGGQPLWPVIIGVE